eukprot:72671-Rhodomonas_salina.3
MRTNASSAHNMLCQYRASRMERVGRYLVLAAHVVPTRSHQDAPGSSIVLGPYRALRSDIVGQYCTSCSEVAAWPRSAPDIA